MRKLVLAVTSIFALGLLFSSCSKDENVISSDLVQSIQETAGFKVSPEQAVDRLKHFIDAGLTKASKEIHVKNIEALTKEKCDTKAALLENIPDTLMYIVNLADEQGFALMSADKRTEPIFALIDSGNFSLKERDSTINPGFEMFLNMTESYITSKIIETKTVSGNGDADWTLTKSTRPKLDYLWDQWDPYNMYTPLENGKHTPVGCVATALGMVTAHFKKSFTINGYNLDLSGQIYTTSDLLANSEKASIVARLLSEIGDKVSMRYFLSGSYAYTNDAEAYLKDVSGIQYVTGFRDYGSNIAVENLYNCLRSKSGLVVIRGTKSDNSVGHMWVMDGVQSYSSTHDSKTLDLFHCNWGWGGFQDGYYLQAIYIFTTSGHFISGGPTDNAPVSYPIDLKYCAVNNKRIE